MHARTHTHAHHSYVHAATRLRAINNATQQTIPLVTAFVVFSVYFKFGGDDFQGRPLTPDAVFATLSLLYSASRIIGFMLPVLLQVGGWVGAGGCRSVGGWVQDGG